MALELVTDSDSEKTLITASGDVDLYSSPQLRQVVLKASKSRCAAVGVNLNAVTYMDSSGVATLVEGLKECGKKKNAFVLVAPSQAVMKVLQLARLDSVFDIRDTL
jgi:anti-sigma B factor antagonist